MSENADKQMKIESLTRQLEEARQYFDRLGGEKRENESVEEEAERLTIDSGAAGFNQDVNRMRSRAEKEVTRLEKELKELTG